MTRIGAATEELRRGSSTIRRPKGIPQRRQKRICERFAARSPS